MYLSKEEEKILSGESGVTLQKAMQLLVTLGDVFKADRLLDIKSAQISGVSYKNIGDAGAEFIRDMARLKNVIKITATLNPAGMDFKDWVKMKIPTSFAEKQLEIIRCFARMGAIPSCTCTPYLIGNLPVRGQHIAWAESSAVSYANSIIGAKTNREGGPISLAASIIGKTPNYGLHIDENRIPNVLVKVKADLKSTLDYSLLGYYMGSILVKGIPVIEGVKSFSLEDAKSLCAAAASSGSIALYYISGITPLPAGWRESEKEDKIEITEQELKNTLEKFNPSVDVDIVTLGCPHATINEIRQVADLIKNKRIKSGKTLWICTSSVNKEISRRLGYSKIIEKAGGVIAADTCMVVAPLEQMGYTALATNSAKAAHYVPSSCNIPSKLCSLEECIKMIAE
ncbi:MAG: aconitase X catalytic domain-containing protein [Candidatus Odinarchaeum yellowstonii]|uniref:Phosphomevalonate dehydratase large subunit n=1 Tax=Odinarchaeota yellowstonii (strain LCB_4) TaxID=1841599 RepID=A0AAF0D3L2_ODILC|nr:MAG: aconitase X catalytic domain-containing protein [Candidatus Odinarchaeum yellowstonii]